MLNQIFEPHLNNLSRAMSRTTDRYGKLSNNLANVNTPGYKRQDIDFGIELESAQGRLALDGPGNRTEMKSGAMRRDGSTVNLETEIAGMAETEARYKLLTEMTSKYFSGMKSVIREGK